MYEGYKFDNLKDIVLFVVAKRREKISIQEIYKELPELNEKNVYGALRKLIKEGIIKNYDKQKGKSSLVGLNIKKIRKIKKIVGNHWETNWESEWENVTGKN